MRKISITEKLALTSLSVSIVIIFFVAAFSFYKAKQIVTEKTFNQLTSVKIIKSNLLKHFFKNKIREIQSVGSSCELKNLFTELNKETKTDFIKYRKAKFSGQKNRFLSEINSKDYARITILGTNNNAYLLKKPEKGKILKDIDFYKIMKEHSTVSGIIINDYKKYECLYSYITLSLKITNRLNQEIGYIIFEINPESIDNFMLENSPENGLGNSGESYLVGKDLLMRSSSRFIKKSLMNTVVNTKAVKNAGKNKFGNAVISDYRGIKVFSSYEKIVLPGLTWFIIAEIDYKEAMVPIYEIKNEIIFFSIFIFLIVLIVVFILSKKITVPVQKLNYAVCEFGKGDVKIPVLKKTNDEIGELTENFIKMTLKISEQKKSLQNEKNKSLKMMIDGQEAERQRLSRELHDGLGQLLIALKLNYESKKDTQNSGIDDFGKLTNHIIEETRRISNNLMPAALSEFGLFTAVRNLCNETTAVSNIIIKAHLSGNEKQLPEKTKIYIFRIIQESISNILKHSKAENSDVRINIFDKEIKIKISDDGIAFDINKNRENKNGLNNIKDRINILNGKLQIRSEISKGTEIIASIPIA